MSAEQWERNNRAWLEAALRWVRVRLQREIEQAKPSTAEAGDIGVPDIPGTDAQLAAAEQLEPSPAMVTLAARLGLSTFEKQVLMLSLAMELDTSIPSLCARAQGDTRKPYPTFALALAICDDANWQALSEAQPLRDLCLIELQSDETQPQIGRPIAASERVVDYLRGLNGLDQRLRTLVLPVETLSAISASQDRLRSSILDHIRSVSERDTVLVELTGKDQGSKDAVAAHIASDLGCALCRLRTDLLPASPEEVNQIARLWRRECLLAPVALMVDVAPCTSASELHRASLSHFLRSAGGLVFISCRERWPDAGAGYGTFEVSNPSAPEQQEAWSAFLDDEAAASLSGQFNLNMDTISSIARQVCATGPNRAELASAAWQLSRAATRPALESLAHRLEAKATWDQIVLPDDVTALLKQMVMQVRHRAHVYDKWGFRERMNRGLGIGVLFAGESGTGKTMAAEVLARELALDLYRIDLSAILSKYIGETEKALRRLFDAAEDGGAILLFDEADALFGKRSEVKDSHDRYANIEIDYLLQRMEAYHGLAILATNMKTALDKAFVRRLRFIVNFPFPTQASRRLIWEKVFPTDTPCDRLDLDRLSRLNLTGGSIHNIALAAAFLAAAREPRRVTMALILQAARVEFCKLERPINEAEFRWNAAAGAA